MRLLPPLFLALTLTAAACGGGSGDDDGSGGADAAPGADGASGADGGDRPPAAADRTRDIVSTAIELDLTANRGKATLELVPSETSTGLTLERGDLSITSVTGAAGALNYDLDGDEINIGLAFNATQVVIEYQFVTHAEFDGWDPASGLTFLWPTFCGNLFPCHSDPADGSTFTMAVTGLPDGATAVFPASIPSQAPSYMPAIAVGAFTKLDLGTTTAGTAVHAWHLPSQAAAAATGTAHLRQVVDFYEQTYGPYSFGDDVGSVSAGWGPGAYGGMEHHPYWHVASAAFDVEEIHAHEAAHGWFGNGVRIACWEDFVLSEGLATYLAARSLGEQGIDLWPGYDCSLAEICSSGGGTIALPSTCDAIDILNDPLWSGVPYQKGAQFLREAAAIIGEDELDEVLSAFYTANVGKAANMEDLLDAIEAAGGAGNATAIETAETNWLRTLACPTIPACTL